jgi:predicted nucleotidyltransferase
MQATQSRNRLENIEPQKSRIIRNFARDTKHLLKKNVIAEYLFGSYATNKQTSLSDIDILIIVKDYTTELQWEMSGLASEYSLKYDVCISPVIQDIRVWEKNRQYRTLFYQEVSEHGVRL